MRLDPVWPSATTWQLCDMQTIVCQVHVHDLYETFAAIRKGTIVEYEFVKGIENDSDMYTKQLAADAFERCSDSARDDK